MIRDIVLGKTLITSLKALDGFGLLTMFEPMPPNTLWNPTPALWLENHGSVKPDPVSTDIRVTLELNTPPIVKIHLPYDPDFKLEVF